MMKVRICLKEFPVQGKRYLKMFFCIFTIPRLGLKWLQTPAVVLYQQFKTMSDNFVAQKRLF